VHYYFAAASAFAGLLLCLLGPVSAPVYDLRTSGGRIELSSFPGTYEHCPSALPFVPERPPVFESGLDLEATAEVQLRAAACNAEKVERWRKAALFGLAGFGIVGYARRRARRDVPREPLPAEREAVEPRG